MRRASRESCGAIAGINWVNWVYQRDKKRKEEGFEEGIFFFQGAPPLRSSLKILDPAKSESRRSPVWTISCQVFLWQTASQVTLLDDPVRSNFPRPHHRHNPPLPTLNVTLQKAETPKRGRYLFRPLPASRVPHRLPQTFNPPSLPPFLGFAKLMYNRKTRTCKKGPRRSRKDRPSAESRRTKKGIFSPPPFFPSLLQIEIVG